MFTRLNYLPFGVFETLERRAYLSAAVQIVPLEGAGPHIGAFDTEYEALAVGNLVPIGVFNPPRPASTIATVQQLVTADRVSAASGSNQNDVDENDGGNTASGGFKAKIDFKPASAATYPGYIADTGLTYGTRNGLSYGWKTSNASSQYDRNSSKSPDQRFDTTALMTSSDVWEIKVPNGWYDVDVYAGDANKGGADLRMNVEGKLALWAQLHYPEKRFGEGHIKVKVTDGKLTVTSGSGAKSNSITHIDIAQGSAPASYTTVNNISWSKSSSISSPASRVESGVVRVGDKVYFIGGYYKDYNHVTSRVDIFDLKTNKWTKGASLPGPQTHAGATTDGRYIYWAGGQYGTLYSRKGTNEVWRYDTQQNKWSRYANLPAVRFGGGLSFVNGTLVFFGGATSDRNTASANAWKLDTKKSGADWVSIASMPRAADHLGHAEVNGVLYSLGGEHDHGNSYVQHTDVYSYDLQTNKWTKRASMPTGSSHFEGNVVEYKGRLYVFGGQVDAQLLTNQVRSYDPAGNKWVLHNSLPEKRKGGGGWVYQDKFYYLTGDAYGKGQPTYALIGSIKTSVSIPGGSTNPTPSPPPPTGGGNSNGNGSITGFLWSDTDGDGNVDNGEPKLAERLAYLDQNRNGKLDSSEPRTTSDSQGNFIFSNLPIGRYYLTRVFPKGYVLSNNNSGYIQVDVDDDNVVANVGAKLA